MGRAQGAKDVFTSVLGNRRGLQTKQAQFSTAPPAPRPPRKTAPFAREVSPALRRMHLMHWFELADLGRPKGIPYILDSSRIYDGLHASAKEQQCRNDIAALLKQGLLVKHQEPGQLVAYTAAESKNWSEEHQDRYRRWKAKGRPTPDEPAYDHLHKSRK